MKKIISTMAVFGIIFTSGVMAADCPKDLPTIEPGKLTMSINATIPPRLSLIHI